MDYTQLGRTGLQVSRLCLGTMNFGPQTAEADCHAIMDAAHEAGHQLLRHRQRLRLGRDQGGTETIVGTWFASGGGRRERTVLATKVYGDMGDWPNDGKLSALNIRRALDASLKRLQTDYIDLYQFHHIDRATPWEEIWQAIEVAVAQGKILYVGSSNFAGWHIAQAQAAAAQRHFIGLVSEQSLYNLLVRDIELEVIPAAEHYGLGHHPVVAAAGRPAGRRDQEGERGRPPARGPGSATASREHRDADPGVRGPGRRARRPSPASSPWPGCCTSRP